MFTPTHTSGFSFSLVARYSLLNMLWTLNDIVKATDGEVLWGDPRQEAGGISIDSRTIAAGEAFVAIRGEVHDGHRFIPEAISRGAAGLVVDRRGREALPAGNRGQSPSFCVAAPDTRTPDRLISDRRLPARPATGKRPVQA